MLPQAQQFTAGQQIAPAAPPVAPPAQQGPSRADVARAQDIAGGVDTGYGLENVRDPWSALAYAVNKGVTGYAQGKAKRMGETQKAADRKALADALNSADPMSALSQLDIPEVQDMMVQSKFAQMSKAPAEKWVPVDIDGDGRNDFQQSSITGEYKDMPRTLSEEEKVRAAGRSVSNVNIGGEKAFDNEMGKLDAQAFGKMADEGTAAKADLGLINELDRRLQKTPGGVLGGVQSLAASVGVQLGENADDAVAAQAIIAKLVPTQREPGSGQMSDRDVLLFKDSLPKLVNSRQGNKLILNTMRAMAKFKLEQAAVVNEVRAGRITRQQARDKILSLPDPMEQFKVSAGRAAPREDPLGLR
jgi:hypothetical protein